MKLVRCRENDAVRTIPGEELGERTVKRYAALLRNLGRPGRDVDDRRQRRAAALADLPDVAKADEPGAHHGDSHFVHGDFWDALFGGDRSSLADGT